MQPQAHFAGGKVDIGLGPFARAGVFGPVELALPIQSSIARSRLSLMPIRRCSGVSTIDNPPSDQNACPPRHRSGS